MLHKIADYEIVDIGVEHPEYFAGIGIAFTKFSKYAVGVGESPAEALEDCLELVALMGYDADELAARIAAEYGRLSDEPAEGVSALADEQLFYEGPLYHVAIRWN